MSDKTRKVTMDDVEVAFREPRMDGPTSAELKPRLAKRVQRRFDLPTRTRASEAPLHDLKTLVRQYQRVGQLPPSTKQYGDGTALPQSRLEALEIIERAREAFYELPLKLRQAIGHDPRKLEAWIAGNPQLAYEYGLLKEAAAAPAGQPHHPADGRAGGKSRTPEGALPDSESGDGSRRQP